MPNLYYCHSKHRGPGILCAVLSSEEGRGLLKEHASHCVEQQFPAIGQNMEAGLVVPRLFEEERNEEWNAAFYRFDNGINQVEAAMHSSSAQLLRSA